MKTVGLNASDSLADQVTIYNRVATAAQAAAVSEQGKLPTAFVGER
jgi:hypothetical protein